MKHFISFFTLLLSLLALPPGVAAADCEPVGFCEADYKSPTNAPVIPDCLDYDLMQPNGYALKVHTLPGSDPRHSDNEYKEASLTTADTQRHWIKPRMIYPAHISCLPTETAKQGGSFYWPYSKAFQRGSAVYFFV